jgi:tetratricopeptide (TPR) repeat protein
VKTITIKITIRRRTDQKAACRLAENSSSVLTFHFLRLFLNFMAMTILSITGFGFIRAGCALLLAFMGLVRPALAVDTNTDGKTSEAAAVTSQEALRSYLQIQEQLRETQSAIERNRQEAQAAAASNTLALEERLQAMEKNLASERLEQLKGMEGWDRMILIAAGVFAVLALLVLLLAVFLQWNAVQRLAAAAAGLSAAHPPQLLGVGEAQIPSHQALELSNTRFLGLMERLERRILELEASVKPPASLPESGTGNGESNGPSEESPHGDISRFDAPDKTGMIDLLVSKSQTLVKLDKPEAALACLDEVLALDPGHADALVKKGAALERLQRFDEAIQCYDRAIAQDNSMTMAYLCKGGVFNRMERYSEALACYEQALKRAGKAAK